jgi:hypothetical protein
MNATSQLKAGRTRLLSRRSGPGWPFGPMEDGRPGDADGPSMCLITAVHSGARPRVGDRVRAELMAWQRCAARLPAVAVAPAVATSPIPAAQRRGDDSAVGLGLDAGLKVLLDCLRAFLVVVHVNVWPVVDGKHPVAEGDAGIAAVLSRVLNDDLRESLPRWRSCPCRPP